MRIAAFAIAAGALAFGAVLAPAAVATAAPTKLSAAETISRLEADGNRVVVNKIGAGSLSGCSVASIRPIEMRPQPQGGALRLAPLFTTVTVMHVDVRC